MGLDINLNTSKIDISEEDGLNVDLYNDNIDISDDEADDIIIEITGLKSLNKFIGLEDTPLYYDNGKFFKVEDNKIVYADIQWKDISGDISESPEIVAVISDLVNEVASDIIDKRISLHNLNTEAHPFIQNIIQENYNTLDTKIDNTKEELSQDISNLNDALNQEISDRKTADNALSEDIQEEILDRIEGDTTLQNNINTLNNNLQNEINARIEGDTNLSNSLNELSNSLIQEVLDRQEQDDILQQQITSNYNTLDGKIDTEISNRTVADTTLQNNINAEALARQNADTTLQGNIDTLSGTVTSNYNALDARITTNTGNISDINTTLSGYGNIVTHNVSEFATSAQGALADTALQPNDNISELVNDVGYITSASLPTDYVPETRTINGYALSSNITLNYTDVGALSASTTINDLTTIAQQNALNSGATTTNIGQITTNANNISDIQDLIPNQATSSNQLADKSFINSSIATNTANFIGTFYSVAELEAYSGTLTNNDYAFVATTDTAGNTLYDRYKYNANTQEWLFEYELNNSSFTAVQWTSINSGATSTNIGQITINANNIADLQTNKQDVISDLTTIRSNALAGKNASDTIATYGNIVTHNVSEFATSSQGALADTALQPNDNISELTNDAGYITAASLPTVNNGTLTIQANGTTVGTFTANQAGNTTANIIVPDSATWGNIIGTLSNQTDLQDALNDKYDASNPDGYINASALNGYATETYVNNGLATKQDTLVSGTNIKTINNQSLLGSGNIDIQGGGTDVEAFTALEVQAIWEAN